MYIKPRKAVRNASDALTAAHAVQRKGPTPAADAAADVAQTIPTDKLLTKK